MLLKPLTVAAAGLAATCTAFLLPPGLSESDISIADTIPNIALSQTQSQSISVDCPGCPMQVKNRHGHIKVKQGKESRLGLNFEVDHQTGTDRLLLNGFELYPNSDPFHNVLTAPQIVSEKEEQEKKNDKSTKLKSHHKMRPGHQREIVPPQLGFSLQIHPEAGDTEGQLYRIIALDLQIIEVANRFVDGIPNVHVKLIKDASGNLMIGNVGTTKSLTAEHSKPAYKVAECQTLMCQWLQAVKAKMSQMKNRPCHGNAGKMGMGQMSGHFRHHGQHGMHDRFRHHHSWGQLFKSIALHIVLPILIGVIAGVSVSLIGMVVGTMIVFTWRMFFRRPHHRHRGRLHKAAPKEAAATEEKSGLMEHQDPPPSYEDQEEESVQKPEP